MNKSFYEKTSPENANINSKRIINFINRLEKEEVDMHSILVMRGNKLICEAYYNPFNSNTLHRMFSVTKSVVSMAIGALAEDGVIDLDASITKMCIRDRYMCMYFLFIFYKKNIFFLSTLLIDKNK